MSQTFQGTTTFSVFTALSLGFTILLLHSQAISLGLTILLLCSQAISLGFTILLLHSQAISLGLHHSSSVFPSYISGVHHSSSAFPSYISGVHHSSSAFPSYISGVHHSSSVFPSRISGVDHFEWDFCASDHFLSNRLGSHILSSWMVHAWCIFVTSIHLPRTWIPGSFESLWWNACVHRLDLSFYSHLKEFWGNGVRTHVDSMGKIPSTRKILPRGGSNLQRWFKQDSDPNTLPTSHSGPRGLLTPWVYHKGCRGLTDSHVITVPEQWPPHPGRAKKDLEKRMTYPWHITNSSWRGKVWESQLTPLVMSVQTPSAVSTRASKLWSTWQISHVCPAIQLFDPPDKSVMFVQPSNCLIHLTNQSCLSSHPTLWFTWQISHVCPAIQLSDPTDKSVMFVQPSNSLIHLTYQSCLSSHPTLWSTWQISHVCPAIHLSV